MFGLDFAVDGVLDQFCDWIYGKLITFFGEFFSMINMMGAELFELDWIKAILLFFYYFAWALYIVGIVVAVFDTAIDAQRGKGSFQDLALNMDYDSYFDEDAMEELGEVDFDFLTAEDLTAYQEEINQAIRKEWDYETDEDMGLMHYHWMQYDEIRKKENSHCNRGGRRCSCTDDRCRWCGQDSQVFISKSGILLCVRYEFCHDRYEG